MFQPAKLNGVVFALIVAGAASPAMAMEADFTGTADQAQGSLLDATLPTRMGAYDHEVVADLAAGPARTAAVTTEAAIAIATLDAAGQPVADTAKITLYRRLMDLNGTTANVHLILKNAKNAIRLVALQRGGTLSLSPQDEIRFDDIATGVLKDAENTLLESIAAQQARSFTYDEISQLIAADSTSAAAKYISARYANTEETSKIIQTYMYDALVKIVKTFKGSVAS